MANPTNPFSWQMPTASDLVTDLPADFETFGQAVANSMADLLGGTSGQILSKASNTDMDFTWITNDVGDITAVTAGTGISGGGTSGAVTITNSMATAIDAKGDLIAGTGADTFSRLAAGANGISLITDSTTSTGLKWGYPTNIGVNLGNSTDQLANNVTEKVLAMNTEFWDTSGFHDNSTNNSRITIPAGLAGRYQFTGFATFTSNATGSRYVGIRKNGGGSDFLSSSPGVSTYSTYVNFNVIYDAVAGDYFEMLVFQNCGAALDVLSLSRFQMTYLGA
jgi:hypothetical protein